ncbi:hypothetical protein FHE72_04535 [Rossellomorea vietnamensis]|uniref:Uncharacterized protein n=1 Tax=Rossellomorea vietnamensis TaxID=218284 RepID=A0A6I6UEJ0_9BACI|nr:hypothetical protein [Rossellomorea vietnamensis]QHE60388.1 hypothetical protein FHE72_04535 [Rossellomorea vietnamensis]
MGIKMKEAFHTVLNKKITIDEARENERLRKPLECISDNCNSKISFVRDFSRQRGEITSVIPAHFKLSKGEESHNENCKFNTSGLLKTYARESDGLLESLENQKFQFRLNLLTNSLKSNSKKENMSLNEKDLVSPSRKSVRYESSGKIDPYLSTIKRILRLKQEVEEDEELRKMIKIDLSGKKIPWYRFYFESNRWYECFRYLNKLNFQNTHPICIEGSIRRINPPKDNFNFYSILLIGKAKRGDGVELDRVPSISVVIKNNELSRVIQKQCEGGKKNISLCSFVTTVGEKNYNSKVIYLNMNSTIFNSKQIHVY